MIKKFRVLNSDGSVKDTVDVGQVDPAAAACIHINESGNFEILGPSGAKVNIVSQAEAIQIKPGKDGTDKVQKIQLDCEQGTSACDEIGIKVCNGALEKTVRVIGTKINTSGIILDTQNVKSPDCDEFKIKYRKDVKTAPIYAKHEARAFDFRCLGHGGIALQIAGQDGSGHENKIKFESARMNPITEATNEYVNNSDGIVEGGKGLEFGTFNNLHTSLFTNDYRFNKNGRVYAATRELAWYDASGNELEQNDLNKTKIAKVDYKTQPDDFKDVTSVTDSATWGDIVGVARAWKNGNLGAASGTAGGGGDHTLEEAQALFMDKNEAYTKTEADAKFLFPTTVLSKTEKGNIELSASGLTKPLALDAPDGTVAEAANLNLASDDKISVKAVEASFETSSITLNGSKVGETNVSTNIDIPVEISKKGNITVSNVKASNKITASSDLADFKSKMSGYGPKIRFVMSKNNIVSEGESTAEQIVNPTIAAITEGTVIAEISLADIINKIASLEARIAALETPAE